MEERVEILARRARRFRARGEFRKAANAYGELTSIDPEAARWWVLLGMMLFAARRTDEAFKALRQAIYRFHQAHEPGKERSVRTLLNHLSDACAGDSHALSPGDRRHHGARRSAHAA